MVKILPKDLSVLSHAQLTDARRTRDEKIAPLFRRWPSLSKAEMKELTRLYKERQQLASYIGMLRRRKLDSPPRP